jgi:DNA-3-methyladenine glycosylase I
VPPAPDGILRGLDGVERCAWAGAAPDYVAYHDTEWGFPVDDDIRLFEKLSLEGFQSGLSWLTILRKRAAFRAAFAGFDFRVLAGYGREDVERLLQDAGIVRHRGKIEAVINNAGRAVELVESEGSLARHVWSFAPGRDRAAVTGRPVPFSEESTRLSKDLKRRGWRFTGPTTAYAFMQSMGLVNDHLPGCAIHGRVEAALATFTTP